MKAIRFRSQRSQVKVTRRRNQNRNRDKMQQFKKNYKSVKQENNRYQTEILKLKHEKDTTEEVIKVLQNTNQFSEI